MEERINRLELTMVEVSTNLKHVVEKLDTIALSMEKFTTTHDDVIQMKERIKSLEKDVDKFYEIKRTEKAKLTAIATAIGTLITIGGQILAHFWQ